MLSLWLWWLKWTRQNAHLGVVDFFSHLWMREIFIENDTLNKLGIFEGTTRLGDNLNQVKVNVLSFKICYMQH